MMLKYLSFFFYCYLRLTFASSSPISTSEIISPRASPNPSLITDPDHDEILKCNELFKWHMAHYSTRTGFLIPVDSDHFYADIFIKAVFFAAFASPNFDEVINDSRISVPCHCFLLEYFLIVFRQARGSRCFYSEFIRNYSDTIALRHQANMKDSEVIKVHVFPLLNELVSTGYFLNYSFLLSTCVDKFDSKQKDQLYSSHLRQYFNRLTDAETPLQVETFKLGLEFLDLYIPRCEILNLVGIENDEMIALSKPFGYYLVAFNPLKAAVERRPSLDLSVRTQLLFKNEIDFFCRLESFLIDLNFLNFANIEDFNTKKSVFNALIHIDNVLLLVNSGFITCFKAWIQFQYTEIDEWTSLLLRYACYESSNIYFRIYYDTIIKE